MLYNLRGVTSHQGVHKPLTIVHCVRSTVGGIFRHIADLIEHQNACGHNVGLICDSLTGGAFEAEQLERLKPFIKLGVVQLPMSRSVSFSDATIIKTIHRLLSDVDVDVVHAHGAKGGVYGRAAAHWVTRKRRKQGRAGVVAIYSPHGGSLHYSPNTLQGKVYFAVERFFENFTNEFIFVAGFEVEAFIRKIGGIRRPWSIAYNGLTDDEFKPVKPARNAVDFVFAGHMRDLKGADLFIDAIEIANARSNEPIQAIMVGDGEDLPRYRYEAERRGLSERITFLDPMPIREVFKLGRNLVVPSRAEAMPYIVLEALAAKVPILTTSVGGIPEIFGANAYHLLAPGDANLIATAMLDRLRRPERGVELAGTLRLQIMRKFTTHHMFKKIDEVYFRHMSGTDAATPIEEEAGFRGSLVSAK